VAPAAGADVNPAAPPVKAPPAGPAATKTSVKTLSPAPSVKLAALN
jgi:hypothetical protein